MDVLHIRDLKLGHGSLHVACGSSTGHSAVPLSFESAAVGGENSFRASFCSDERELPSGICTWKCKYMSPKLLRSSCCTPMPLSTCCDLGRTNPHQVDALNCIYSSSMLDRCPESGSSASAETSATTVAGSK